MPVTIRFSEVYAFRAAFASGKILSCRKMLKTATSQCSGAATHGRQEPRGAGGVVEAGRRCVHFREHFVGGRRCEYQTELVAVEVLSSAAPFYGEGRAALKPYHQAVALMTIDMLAVVAILGPSADGLKVLFWTLGARWPRSAHA
jgi:hypothetical protein